ncbi:hypothetical protein D3C76_1739400 [compost metagenome]
MRTLLTAAGAVRSFGLMISSMLKLMSERPQPNNAIMRPGGTNHHHAPIVKALCWLAWLSMVPQVIAPDGPSPR